VLEDRSLLSGLLPLETRTDVYVFIPTSTTLDGERVGLMGRGRSDVKPSVATSRIEVRLVEALWSSDKSNIAVRIVEAERLLQSQASSDAAASTDPLAGNSSSQVDTTLSCAETSQDSQAADLSTANAETDSSDSAGAASQVDSTVIPGSGSSRDPASGAADGQADRSASARNEQQYADAQAEGRAYLDKGGDPAILASRLSRSGNAAVAAHFASSSDTSATESTPATEEHNVDASGSLLVGFWVPHGRTDAPRSLDLSGSPASLAERERACSPWLVAANAYPGAGGIRAHQVDHKTFCPQESLGPARTVEPVSLQSNSTAAEDDVAADFVLGLPDEGQGPNSFNPEACGLLTALRVMDAPLFPSPWEQLSDVSEWVSTGAGSRTLVMFYSFVVGLGAALLAEEVARHQIKLADGNAEPVDSGHAPGSWYRGRKSCTPRLP
jgi:hypothetical protein